MKRLVAVCALMVVTAASAVIPGDPTACQVLGRYAREMANARDSGQTIDQVLEYTEGLLRESLGEEGSIVQTQEDAEYVRSAVRALWGSSKDDPPPIAGIHTMLRCMGK